MFKAYDHREIARLEKSTPCRLKGLLPTHLRPAQHGRRERAPPDESVQQGHLRGPTTEAASTAGGHRRAAIAT